MRKARRESASEEDVAHPCAHIAHGLGTFPVTRPCLTKALHEQVFIAAYPESVPVRFCSTRSVRNT